MFLAVAATSLEMTPFTTALEGWPCPTLICGMGPVLAALRLSTWLHSYATTIEAVINFGVAGIFPETSPLVDLLDICLATGEILGDFGICDRHAIHRFDQQMSACPDRLPLDPQLLADAETILHTHGIACHCGLFITVNSATATRQRARILSAQYRGLCENMEGFALALACREYHIPFLELRCISNLVGQRNRRRWRLEEAAQRAGKTAALVVRQWEQS